MAKIVENLKFDEMFAGRRFVPKEELEAEANLIEFENQKKQKHNQIEYEQRDREHIEKFNKEIDEILEQTHEDDENNEKNKKNNEQEVNPDTEVLKNLIAMAVEQDNAEIYNALAVTYLKISKPNEALNYFKKSADLGYIPAMRNLAITLEHSKNVEYKEVFKLYEKAIAQNDMYSLNNLGCLYIDGNGKEMDYSKAAECFKKAANLGDIFAKVNYANMIMYGIGVDINREKAFNLYSEAAEKGNIIAISKVGDCYLNGSGVKTDVQKAVEFYKQAEKLGDKDIAEKLKRIENKKEPQRHEKVSIDIQLANAKKKVEVEKQATKEPKTQTKSNEVSL